MITLKKPKPIHLESEQVSHESFRESLQNDFKESFNENKSFINNENKPNNSMNKSEDESFMELNDLKGYILL